MADDATITTGALSPASYLDILITELDRTLAPEVTSGRAKHLIAPIRRILVRMSEHVASSAPLAENLADTDSSPPTTDGWEAAMREAVALDAIEARADARLASVATPLGAAQGEVTREAVETYLRSHGHPDAVVVAFRKLDGGRSKETILLEVENVVDLPSELVIRRDLAAGVVGTTVEDEYRLLRALTDQGFIAPRPYLLELDTSAIGTAFMLMERAAGGVICDVMDAPSDKALVLQAAEALGRLHSFDGAALADCLPAHAQAKPAGALAIEVAEAKAAWAQNGRAPSAIMTAALDWLTRHEPRVRPLDAIVHGDFSFHNLLYDDNRMTAVLDWELARAGHPAEDLGYFRVLTSSQDLWPEFMATYRAAGGPDVAEQDIVFFAMLKAIGLMMLLFRARYAFETGMVPDIQLADVTIFHLPRIIHKMSRELRRASS